MTMRLGPGGTALIQSYEKLRLRAYRDSKGVPTIGWGHTRAAGGLAFELGDMWTREQADGQFAMDVRKFENIVNECVKVPLTQNEFDALMSFEFNTGGLAKSALLKKLNAGNKKSVPSELLKWTKCGGVELAGLVRRRKDEVHLWLEVDTTAAPEEVAGSAETPDAPKPKGMVRSKIGNGSIAVGVAAAAETVKQVSAVTEQVSSTAKTAHDIVTTPMLVHIVDAVLAHPALLVAVGATAITAAIWFWRWQDMQGEAS
jgi:lysozyme